MATMPRSAARRLGPSRSADGAADDRHVGPQLSNLPIAQRYHVLHSESASHFAGVQPGRSTGRTTQPSRRAMLTTAGSHICACESPMTTIERELPVVPSGQILLEV